MVLVFLAIKYITTQQENFYELLKNNFYEQTDFFLFCCLILLAQSLIQTKFGSMLLYTFSNYSL